MNDSILNWLLEDENPEVKLRTLKEALHLPDSDEKVIECKKQLLESKTYARALNRLHKPKNWDKYDAILAFAEWGLTRADIGKDIDDEVFGLIEALALLKGTRSNSLTHGNHLRVMVWHLNANGATARHWSDNAYT